MEMLQYYMIVIMLVVKKIVPNVPPFYPPSSPPKTGDVWMIGSIVVLVVGLALMVIAIIIVRKGDKNEKKF